MISWEDLDHKLREISQLRSLFVKLPRVSTPYEVSLLKQFEAFQSGGSVLCSREATFAGLRVLWQHADLPALLKAFRKLSRVLQRDRDVRTYAAVSHKLIGPIRRVRPGDSVRGLNDLLNAWDPMGVAGSVADEYASYSGGLLTLLAHGADARQIAEELTRIVSERMCLEPAPAREYESAAAIVAWYHRLAQARG